MATATEARERKALKLTEACWPVFDFLINFQRLVKHNAAPPPDQVRYEAVAALRDAEDLARDEPAVERLWNDRVKAMLVYLIDYKMLNTEWAGRDFWFDQRFETDRTILDHVEALGGEKFFEDCDEMQREYEQAERRDRSDKDALAEQLSLYFTCLRLGFRGMYHDRPQELADYTRRLFSRLPAHATTRGKEMFPDAYKHNQEVKIDYRLGMSLTIVLISFAVILTSWIGVSRYAWSTAVADMRKSVEQWRQSETAPPPAAGGQPSSAKAG